MFQKIINTATLFVIRHPVVVLVSILVLVAANSVYISNLNIDASSDSLMLESDPDLKYYREVHREYGTDESIIVAFKPNKNILRKDTIAFIQEISQQLSKIKGVYGVISLSSVPLLHQMIEDEQTGKITFATLLSKNVEFEKARQEFETSPIYSNNLISKDLSITAMVVNIEKSHALTKLLEKRYVLLDQLKADKNKQSFNAELALLRDQIGTEREVMAQRYKEVLSDIRSILATVKQQGEFYLAGVPLISHDIKEYVVQDIRTFGIAILGMMVIILFLFFRKPAWIFLALVCAVLNVLLVAGLASSLGFQLTIISSNFVALLIIFSITLSIHVIIRYQEIHSTCSNDGIDHVIKTTVSQIITPCSYMVLTSTIAFLSLVVSDINPVITFGFIMILGLLCAFLLTFTILPALIKLIKPQSLELEKDVSTSFLEAILRVILKHKKLMLAILAALFVLNLFGISQLTVENRFIDYFKKSTDIYQGLAIIDQDLGGTVPLEVIVLGAKSVETEEQEEDEEFDDYLLALEETQEDFTATSYWYNRSGIKKIRKIHEYLEQLPQVGYVSSLSSTEEVLRVFNNGEALEDLHLSWAYSKIPEDIKEVLIAPYVSAEGHQARILARIKDSDHTLIRNDLLNEIEKNLDEKFIKPGEQFHLTGISVLYNNVLQSLFRSQILTLGTVFVVILIMLIILFRSIKLAIIGTLPNIFTALFILGCMGIFGIPLDIMTITVAAITIGIGVDYAIHYIHRYRKEYASTGDNYQAIHTSQTTVGKALYFTSITITLGFIVLVLSNFVPSIYFGLLTSTAMLISLFATFSIIPLLLTVMYPNRA